MRRMKIAATTAMLVIVGGAFTACGNAGEEDAGGDEASESAGESGTSPISPEAATDCTADKFPEGSAMAKLADAGEVTVGVRFDQPGLGFKDAAEDVPVGFDVDIAKLLVADLCIDPESDAVTWEETISDNREPYLQKGRVDLVAASYSITDERRKLVGQTGPYMVTGQRVLVAEDSDVTSIEDLKGEEVCSAEGSTSLENVNEAGAVGVPSETYGQCAEDVDNGTVPAMSTDGSILLGLAAQYDGSLKVVGEEFSEERIGVGYSKDAPEMCEWINGVLEKSFADGTWAQAYAANLGGEGVEVPGMPELDACQS